MTSIETGQRVVVARLLEPAWLGGQDDEHTKNRALEVTGTLFAWFGADRQKVWVNHGDGVVGAYSAAELELLH